MGCWPSPDTFPPNVNIESTKKADLGDVKIKRTWHTNNWLQIKEAIGHGQQGTWDLSKNQHVFETLVPCLRLATLMLNASEKFSWYVLLRAT